ncbi:NAD-P-binding protein [Laetiporus sulphureus 93-53]|uniref:NAD-P-binding protein n=1 Tax=Laetiporus sulphureus 93-53 TaxID=1314785 RepID=A0A165B048_9APHY|nr:NAD-P-binding protein [Laetiporus sulphureus 93-53]KZS99977.1 NAD-P-binding protein [Laetiporus sulphureus 93-53]
MAAPSKTREYRLPKPDSIRCLTLQEAPLSGPKSTEVLVKVHAVSLNYRDIMIAKNQYAIGQKENLVPCSDMAGEIIALGDQVEGWNVGDSVCANFRVDHIFGDVTDDIKGSALGGSIDGVLTEYKTFPAHACFAFLCSLNVAKSLVRIPPHLSYEEASTLPCAAVTAYNALMGSAPMKGGDTVLVQGTGGVSIFGLQFAVASGATVIATSSSDQKLEIAAKLGAHHLINYNKTPDWDKEVMKITNGRGVDHILEVGGAGTLVKSTNSVRYGGTITMIGSLAGAGDIDSVPRGVHNRAAFLRGIRIGSRIQFEAMNRLISANGIKPIVNKVFSFDDAIAAYEYLESQKHVGKVVIRVSKD